MGWASGPAARSVSSQSSASVHACQGTRDVAVSERHFPQVLEFTTTRCSGGHQHELLEGNTTNRWLCAPLENWFAGEKQQRGLLQSWLMREDSQRHEEVWLVVYFRSEPASLFLRQTILQRQTWYLLSSRCRRRNALVCVCLTIS